MKKKRILYIMGVDWQWIYQRPQIMADFLGVKYDVTVVFPRSILRLKEQIKNVYPKKYKILWILPKQEKNLFIKCVASIISKRIFSPRRLQQYDIVLIGYPLYYRYIPQSYRGTVIYDCMDNHEALFDSKKHLGSLIQEEKRLIKECDKIIVTSKKLLDKMVELTADDKVRLIRNATDLNVIVPPKEPVLKKRYKIGYFGTISNWFDYDLLQKSVKVIDNIDYFLIGPVHKKTCVENEHIFFLGEVKHELLYEVSKDFDCLIMPFVVNEVVEWVDPVKLYEYIALGKCIVSIKYAEIERFSEFVYFYSSEQEYITLLIKLIENGFAPKYTKKQQLEFLEQNSWNDRFQKFQEVLDCD